jgi:hypothetical protein
LPQALMVAAFVLVLRREVVDVACCQEVLFF